MPSKFELVKESNKEFYDIFDASNDLWESMNDLQSDLMNIRISSIRPKKGILAAKKIGKQITNVVKDYNLWYKKATDFSFNPVLTIGAGDSFDIRIGYLHYTSILNNRITQLRHKIDNLTLGYYQIAELTRYKKSQLGSILFFSISILLAIILAIASLVLNDTIYIVF